jgi:hypothetical protein
LCADQPKNQAPLVERTGLKSFSALLLAVGALPPANKSDHSSALLFAKHLAKLQNIYLNIFHSPNYTAKLQCTDQPMGESDPSCFDDLRPKNKRLWWIAHGWMVDDVVSVGRESSG